MRFISGATYIQREGEFHWLLARGRFALKLSMRLRVMILAFIMCLLALTILIALSKSPEAPSDVFAPYLDFFPGQYWTGALESTFRCNIDLSSGVKYCFFGPQDDLFADIGLTIIDSQITQIVFTLKQNTFKVGDFAALWGRPKIQIAGYLAYLDWQNQKIRAIARTDDGRFDYLLPLSSIAFY